MLRRQLGVASYIPTEWRLLLDSSKQSLKCVLLTNGNLYEGVPVGHSVHLRETTMTYSKSSHQLTQKS